MNSPKKQGPRFRVGDWVSFQYGPRQVSAKVVEDRGRLGVLGQRLYRVQLDDKLADTSAFEMPENELDTTDAPLRQSFHIRYSRQGNSNIWLAHTVNEGLLRGVKAKGAVSYINGSWQGQTAENQKHATVGVLLEVDARSSDANIAGDHVLRRELAERARRLADEMFVSRHPRAQIQHARSPE
jgi:hypothetical protein